MARQCGLVNARQRIYFGDLTEQKHGKKPQILWKDFDYSDHSLNPDTLVPEQNEEEDEDEIIESDEEEKQKEDELKELAKKLANGEDRKNNLNNGKKNPKTSSLIFSLNREEIGKTHFKSMEYVKPEEICNKIFINFFPFL